MSISRLLLLLFASSLLVSCAHRDNPAEFAPGDTHMNLSENQRTLKNPQTHINAEQLYQVLPPSDGPNHDNYSTGRILAAGGIIGGAMTGS